MFIRNFSINILNTHTSYNNQTFTANDSIPIVYIRDSQTNNYLENISCPSFAQVRKLILMNNRQIVIISTPKNDSLTSLQVNNSIFSVLK
jgi:hypothetical protein